MTAAGIDSGEREPDLQAKVDVGRGEDASVMSPPTRAREP